MALANWAAKRPPKSFTDDVREKVPNRKGEDSSATTMRSALGAAPTALLQTLLRRLPACSHEIVRRGTGMLVCSANWLLSDGSLTRPLADHDLAVFLQSLTSLAARAGFRRDGRYRPVERVDLVLAGDIFDLLSSARWGGAAGPWDGTHTSQEIKARILTDCLRYGRRALAALRHLRRRGMSVPAATPQGRPSHQHGCRVPVRVVLLAGDRDEALFLTAGSESPAPALPWPPAVLTQWGDDVTVGVSHGHQLDPSAASDGSSARPPTVSESVAIGLVSTLVRRLQTRLGHNTAGALARDLAGSHPLAIPRVLAAWMHRHDGLPRHTSALTTDWRQSVSDWHRAARRMPPLVHDLRSVCTDRLAGWLADWQPGHEPSPPPADLSAALAVDTATLHAHASQQGGRHTVLAHVPMPSPPTHGSAFHAPTILSLVSPAGAPPARTLSWTALFEHGEHGGLSHTSSWNLSATEERGYAPVVVGSHGSSTVVDVLRAA